MRKCYENQLLGAFIFAFGFAAGSRGYRNALVNLFQQTPRDQLYGDAVVGTNPRIGKTLAVAIEFKRSMAGVSQEKRKWKLTLAKSCVEGQKDSLLSRKGHLFAYGDDEAENGEQIWITAFEDAIFGVQEVKELRYPHVINDLLPEDPENAAVSFGVDPVQLRDYLIELSKHRKKMRAESDVASAWLAVAVGSQGFQILVATSLGELVGLMDPASLPKPYTTMGSSEARYSEHD